MLAIADATPLRYLIEIGSTGILHAIFGRIIIPTAVALELQHQSTPQPVRAWIANPPTWTERHAPQHADTSLNYLGPGEQEAILLASELHADWLILDDAAGRREATRRGLPVLGTLRVLDEAATRGLIDLPQTLDLLRQTTFHVSPKLLGWLLSRHAKRT